MLNQTQFDKTQNITYNGNTDISSIRCNLCKTVLAKNANFNKGGFEIKCKRCKTINIIKFE